MKRFLILVALMGLFAIGAAASTALADKPPEPPGTGPCQHGNSQKPCKEDPQADKGKDCDEHGPKKGGENQDHCAGSTQPPTNPPPTITTGKPDKPITVETKPGEPVTVSGPVIVVEKKPGVITVKPTNPGIVKVSQPTKVTLIGVPKQDKVGESLTG